MYGWLSMTEQQVRTTVTQQAKSAILAGFSAAVVSLAFFMPLTLHLRIPESISPVAWYFCPESGLFAPQYYHSRSSDYDPSHLVACLDTQGNRIESVDKHTQIVWSIAAYWFAFLLPPFLLATRPLFRGREGPREDCTR
jgi:hypothetical protein